MEDLINELRGDIWIYGVLLTIMLIIARIEGETARKWKLCILAIFAWPLVLGWRLGTDIYETEYHARRTLEEMREEFQALREKTK